MAILKDCVVIGDQVYCWDDVTKQVVATNLEVDKKKNVPEEAIKQVCMKHFNLKEGDE